MAREHGPIVATRRYGLSATSGVVSFAPFPTPSKRVQDRHVQSPAGVSRHAAPNLPQIRVTAPARLHFGFIDLHGGLGRRFGSLGLAIDRPAVRLRASRAANSEIVGPGAERVSHVLSALNQRYGVDLGARVEIEEAIPSHAGLGSGTQITLAAAVALCALSGQIVSVPELARGLQRGARSGIGAGVFELGGF